MYFLPALEARSPNPGLAGLGPPGGSEGDLASPPPSAGLQSTHLSALSPTHVAHFPPPGLYLSCSLNFKGFHLLLTIQIDGGHLPLLVQPLFPFVGSNILLIFVYLPLGNHTLSHL